MSRQKTTIGLGIVLAAALVMTAGADTHYVAHGGQTPSGTYTSWESAASNIQDAVTASANLDTVLVSNGLYNAGGTAGSRVELGTKNITLQAVSTNPYDTAIDAGHTNRVITSQTGNTIAGFVITNGYIASSHGAGLYYGWASGPTNLVLTNCIIEGNLATGIGQGGGVYSSSANYPIFLKNCILRGNTTGANGGAAVNSILTNYCQVLNNNATNSNSSGGGLMSCTMYGGTLAGNQANGRGGADRCYLYDVTVSNNVARGAEGGGLYTYAAYGCRFYNNSAAANYGGGIYNTFASNCWFSGNYAYYGGAAAGSGATLIGCVISNNGVHGTAGYGGGMYDGLASNCLFVANTGYMGGATAYGTTLIDCLISNNAPRYYAGISYVGASGSTKTGMATRCVIIGNTAASGCYGGGAVGYYMTNCLIVKNKATAYSGANACWLVNCTIASNECTSATFGGIQAGFLTNCIVWGNYQSGTILNYSGSPVFAFSCTTPLPVGNGNTNANPQFEDAVNGNYRLTPNSPCVDAGTNQAWMAGDIDLDRGIRIDKLSGRVDMGVYEYMHHGALFSFR